MRSQSVDFSAIVFFQAVEADYEAVPIDEYGMAMLRGMGWSEGTPIGLSNKRQASPFG